MEDLNYHQRLKKLKLYSLERRPERFMLINTWQQFEGLRENVLQFRERWIGRNRNIKSNRVPTSPLNIIHYSPARKMERLFNCLPQKIKAITGVKTETFKKRLDDWLRNVPDQPKIDDYGASVAAETNSIVHQVRYAR